MVGSSAGRRRVLVVDDQPLFASGIALVIDAAEGLEVVAEVGSGQDALDVIVTGVADVVLLDLRMPGMSGLAVLRRLRDAGDSTPVVVLTTLRHERAVYEALRSGAAAFLTKDAAPVLLLETIRRVLDGDRAVGAPELRDVLVRHGDASPPARSEALLPELTERERVVYVLCARGLTNAEIAAGEHVSVATVKSQVAAVLRKLGLASRVQLAIHAYENGVVRPTLAP
ncbi:DNA-binding response regulator [Tersicoccus solisilvae]|uniref:DNA-binding response regulator n=2 Tax=Tersicoccus solisilvae TaxID=1882339 RepID=A0ABQ1NR35_9MICC|nr:DNA-binding response regulator [Tersicoccus solisilvae]